MIVHTLLHNCVLCPTLGRINFFHFSVARISKYLEQFCLMPEPHTATLVWTSAILCFLF